MQIAYIGHRLHQRSRSTTFLLDLLKTLGSVESFTVDPVDNNKPEWSAAFVEEKYDLIIVFQVFEPFYLLSGRHRNVTFVPMYDGLLVEYDDRRDDLAWKPIFNTAKVMCFSWRLRRELMRQGATYAHFQYYPNPESHQQIEHFDSLRGLFWYRRREISPEFIFDLCQGTEFERLAVHYGPDPGQEIERVSTAPPNILSLQHTLWSDSPGEFAIALRESNVFFAPRPREGIGMSVLEAMASGLCVVARDAPTMNEYISNGSNGLLYNRDRHAGLDFSGAHDIG